MIALLGVGVLSACGGSSEPRSTRAEMVKQAEAVCARGLNKAEALRTTSDPSARGKEAAAEVDATLATLNEQIDGFARLRAPESTDEALDTAVRELQNTAQGLETLRGKIVEGNRTVNEAVQASSSLVGRINLATAKAHDALKELGFLSCIGLAAGSG